MHTFGNAFDSHSKISSHGLNFKDSIGKILAIGGEDDFKSLPDHFYLEN